VQNNSSQHNGSVDSSVYTVELDDSIHFTSTVSTLTFPSVDAYGACVNGNYIVSLSVCLCVSLVVTSQFCSEGSFEKV